MAEVKPFKGLLFCEKAGDISQLCCPPYDIISEEKREEYLRLNEYNVIRLELPREGSNPYLQANENLKSWIANGVMKNDSVDSYYIYEERFEVEGKPYSFKGFLGRVKLEEFEKGVVLPHEETLSGAKADRFDLMCATDCNFSPIYSLYLDPEGKTPSLLEKMTKTEPIATFCDEDKVTHILWRCEDSILNKELSKQFSERKLYIADGHHRYETGINYRNHARQSGIGKKGDGHDYIMMMLVDMQNEGLVVFPTHRIVMNINNFSKQTVLDRCLEYFDVEKASESSINKELKEAYSLGKKAFGFVHKGEYYLLKLRDISVMDEILPNCSKALRQLDVSVLHSLILERILGIDKENMAKQINLRYTRSLNEAIKAADTVADCCFIINPTRIDEICDVASAGEKMPQKSTYFYPKLTTGLVMNKMDN